MVRNEWELGQHARHVRREAMDAASRRRMLALAESGNGGRRGIGAVAAEAVAGWLEGAARHLRRAAGSGRIEPAMAGSAATRLNQGC